MRGDGLVVAGGLTMAAASIVSGAGYALTPATGPPGARFGAFGDPWVEPFAAVAGLLGGATLLVTTVWLAGRLRGGGPRGSSLAVTSTVVAGFVLAAKVALWLHWRADPSLPPSWDWLRIPLWIGLLGAATWLAGVALVARSGREGRGPGGLPPV